MYKVSYYINGGSTVSFKWFDSLAEATEFSNKQNRHNLNSVLEIKLYVEQKKQEDRT